MHRSIKQIGGTVVMIDIFEKIKVLKLKDVSIDMHQGINTVTESVQYLESGVPIIQSKNITSGYLNLEDVRYLSERDYLKYKQKYQPSPDDVLVCNIGTIGKSLRIKESDQFLIAWNLFIIKLDNNLIFSQYFAHYLNHLTELKYFDKFLTGGTIKFINKKSMQDIPIPLPPLATQQKIAAILDVADAYRQKTKTLIEKYDQLAQSLFVDMFGDPVRNSKGFDLCTIRDLIIDAKYGTSSASEEKGVYPYLRMNNITFKGYMDYTNLKYIDISEKDKSKYLVKKGDVLFNRTNSKELVGKTGIIEAEAEMIIAGYLIRVRVNELANPYYLWAHLNSNWAKLTLLNMCKSIVGMANINAQEMQEIKILKAPIALQNQFAERIQAIGKQKQQAQASLQKAEDLFNSLLQRAFKGELTAE